MRDLLQAIVDRGAPSHANHVLAYLRAMLNWAVGNDLLEANPAAGLEMPAPKVERDRALTDNEIRLFWFSMRRNRLAVRPTVPTASPHRATARRGGRGSLG